MEMKVDSKLIRTEREKRAWSQEHLAEVTGLSLRTIQRIETAGAASFESVRALAAVLDLDAAALRLEDPAPAAAKLPPLAWPRRALLGAAAAALAAAGGLFVTSTGFAEQILLDVGISMDNPERSVRQLQTRMLVDEGTLVPNVNALAVGDMLKFEVVPTVTDEGRILLATKVFVRDGDEYVLVSSPRLVAENGKEAEIRITTDDGTLLRFVITAQRSSLL